MYTSTALSFPKVLSYCGVELAPLDDTDSKNSLTV